jgi:predicted ferric reductase
MIPKIHLFDGELTLSQQLLILLWITLIACIVAVWMPTSSTLGQIGLSGKILAAGQLLGLLGTYFALTQFMLMGRISWIERGFGLDRLASFHRVNGYLAIVCILLHPVFITLSHMLLTEKDFVSAYISIFSGHPYTLLALIAEILFVTVVISSMYISRKRLKFEIWYFVHLMVYLAIILVSFHQFANGTTLLSSDTARYFWFGLYGAVSVHLLIWRIGLPIYAFLKFDFYVSRVETETPTVTSIYIKGHSLRNFRIKPGQFIMVRIITRELWWQEHPFTVSWIPKDDELRITVRRVGDYTATLQNLKPSAKVIVSGPYGRFTSDVAVTDKRLFIAGGIGITPLRSLAEQAVRHNVDAVLLYANKTESDVPLKNELDTIGIKTVYVYSEKPPEGEKQGMIDGEMIERLVPDVRQRDVYICGPHPMMTTLLQELRSRGVSPKQIHYESFALHNA